MGRENCSSLTEFLFLKVTTNSEIKVTLFIILIAVYFINILTNLEMIILIRSNSQLCTPMYIFLSHFSCDLCYSTAVGPKMLGDFFAKSKLISFVSCALQFFIFCVFADSECLLLAVMAFDRYKAISNPFLYTVNMSSRVCSMLMSWVYLVGILDALAHMTLAFCLCFCVTNEINHFFCDLPPLYLFSCFDIQVNELVLITIFGFIELSTISGVIVSYCFIILSILKIHFIKGRLKSFSTRTSHLTAVAIFQGTILFIYFQPSSSYSLEQDKMTYIFYTIVISMLNPLIYSLWNNVVKGSLERLKNKRWF